VGQATIESRLAAALDLPTATPLPDLLRQLAQVPPGNRRVLLLDEADVFVAADAARGYACLNGFRSLSDEGRCHFILAGFWSLYRSASFDYQSPIKNFAETIQIGALEPEACRDLVTKPMAALVLTYANAGMVERILEHAGGRANLIAILCDQMLQGLGLAQRVLDDSDLERALTSGSLRSALEGWGELTADPAAARLDRVIVYGLIGRERFRLADVLDLPGLLQVAPQSIKESLTRLELAFLVGRAGDGYRWQVPPVAGPGAGAGAGADARAGDRPSARPPAARPAGGLTPGPQPIANRVPARRRPRPEGARHISPGQGPQCH